MKNKSLDIMKRMGMNMENPIVKENNFLGNNNKSPMVSLNELNAKSLIDKHSKNGYVIVSPCRGYNDFGLNPNTDKEKLANINNKRIKDLIDLIKQSGFSYTPVYGGFIENQGEENEESVYERSFIIYPFTKKGELKDFNILYNFAIEMAKMFNQDSVLIKAPNTNAKYVKQNGETDFEFGDNISFNDLSQTYFTDLHKNTNKFNNIEKRTPTRFSFTECYINPSPQSLNESHTRWLNNEIFISYLK